jgi:hypothetical protein
LAEIDWLENSHATNSDLTEGLFYRLSAPRRFYTTKIYSGTHRGWPDLARTICRRFELMGFWPETGKISGPDVERAPPECSSWPRAQREKEHSGNGPRIVAAIALGGGTCACSELRQTTYPKQRDTPARPGWIGTLTVSAVPNRPRLPASMQAPQLTQTDASPALTLAPHLALAAVDGVAGPVVLSLQLAQSPPLLCPALPLG